MKDSLISIFLFVEGMNFFATKGCEKGILFTKKANRTLAKKQGGCVMKKMSPMCLFVLMLSVVFSEIVFAADIDEPANLGRATDPPAGALMTMIPTGDGGVLLTVKGMEVYKDLVYLYGGDGIETATLVNGTVKLTQRRWINLCFKGSDGLWHYLLVSVENQVVPKEWMGENVCTMPDFGQGSAIVYCGWIRDKYKNNK
ncbi:MAG: hypothetical protein US15_C0017G0009 [Candidatus Moranbacteria bacterium GW2011_GWF1_36_4]|nr:MAG: hypothetical protein US15_C0017G0009 [Candidatus Moranbacteria bacterium GW2011_GWF1_36_4]